MYRNNQEITKLAVSAVTHDPDVKIVAIVAATRQIFKLKSENSIADLETKHFEPAFEGMQGMVRLLTASGKKVVLVIDNPTLAAPEDCEARTTYFAGLNWILGHAENTMCKLKLSQFLVDAQKYRRLIQAVAATDPQNITVFDPTNILCDSAQDFCPSWRLGRPQYSYTDHLSDSAAGAVGEDLNQTVSKIRID